jgi:type I restriction enzyme S subunit
MSNEVEAKTVTDHSKHEWKPKMRFPEFRDAPAWEEKPLSSVLDYERPDQYIVSDTNYQNHGIPVLTANKSFILGYTNETAGIFDEVPVIIFDDFTTDKKYVDFPFKVKSSAIKILKRKEGNNLKVIFELMRCIPFEAKEHKRYYISEYQNSAIALPEPAEQQKLAECLSSLDELLTAHGQKLDALKAHKKGLMRQLFPREGENIPGCRFPAFHGSPEWISDSLGNIFNTSSGGTPERSLKAYWNGDIPWITTSLVDFNVICNSDEFITEMGLNNSSAKLFPKKTVLIAMYGQGKTRGKVALLGIEAATNQACAAILPRDDIDPHFVFLNLAGRYEEMRGLSNSGGQENLSQGLLKGLSFSYPKDIAEQQQISGCLSSFDELITAQAEKLEALNAHKQGLMRQIFPFPMEVEA